LTPLIVWWNVRVKRGGGPPRNSSAGE